jgi:hypothetical protein
MAPFPGTDKISFCPYTLLLIAIIIPERKVRFKSRDRIPAFCCLQEEFQASQILPRCISPGNIESSFNFKHTRFDDFIMMTAAAGG